MPSVSLSRCADYSPALVAASLAEALEPLGGMSAFVSSGQRVLLKVNLLSRALPERAVTTHPEVVRALIREVKACGGIPTVGDSPGGPNTAGMVRRVWADSGIGDVCREEGVDLVLFDEDTVRVPAPNASLYGSFTLGRAVVETDVLICVPKFKTHGFMMFTGAVKNLFGCIPGLEKAEYHIKVPARDDFADMLLDLMLACKPALSVMDAVVGMEGEGPAGGTPKAIGAILASADACALDLVASSMAGLAEDEVYTVKMAARRGLAPARVDEVSIIGADWRELAPESFELPAVDLSRKMPAWVGVRLRAWLTAKPVLESQAGCTRCKTCEQVCPVEAIVVTAEGPVFDRSKCIRCYCCQELCPPQVIGLSVPPVARVLSRRR